MKQIVIVVISLALIYYILVASGEQLIGIAQIQAWIASVADECVRIPGEYMVLGCTHFSQDPWAGATVSCPTGVDECRVYESYSTSYAGCSQFVNLVATLQGGESRFLKPRDTYEMYYSLYYYEYDCPPFDTTTTTTSTTTTTTIFTTTTTTILPSTCTYGPCRLSLWAQKRCYDSNTVIQCQEKLTGEYCWEIFKTCSYQLEPGMVCSDGECISSPTTTIVPTTLPIPTTTTLPPDEPEKLVDRLVKWLVYAIQTFIDAIRNLLGGRI